MKPIVSRKHIIKFYLLTLFLAAVWIAMAFSAFVVAKDGHAILYFISLLIVAIACYTVIKLFKNAPTICVDENTIRFNKRVYYWHNIEKIKLTGKQPYKYFINSKMEGMALKFKDNITLYAFDNNYSNLWRIKSFIHNVILKKEKYYFKSEDETSIFNTYHENFDFFRGSPFFSFRGIIAWSFPIFFLGLIIASDDHRTGLVFVLFISFFWLVGNSFFMYYFGVSENYLIIRNHHFLWVKKIIPLSEVKEVVFETQARWPNCIRLVTRGFRSYLYPAGTLNDKKWRELLIVLRKNKIKVRNEIGI